MQPGRNYQVAEWSPVLFKAVQQGHTLSNELLLLGLSVGASEGLIVPQHSAVVLFLFLFLSNQS